MNNRLKVLRAERDWSQSDLADRLAVSRQSVNRQLKLWEEDGTLRVRYRGIELLNRAQLEQHAAAPG